jgi:hypothetical protein
MLKIKKKMPVSLRLVSECKTIFRPRFLFNGDNWAMNVSLLRLCLTTSRYLKCTLEQVILRDISSLTASVV